MNLWRRAPQPSARQHPPWYQPPPAAPVALEWGWQPPVAEVRSRPWLHLLLFLLTLTSMAAAGAMQQGVDPFAGRRALVHLIEGVPFAATLLAILTVHEFGHYFAARRWQVRASLPYFLPLPYVSLLGTLGAVIRLRSAIPNRKALLDIGAAGPLCGLVLAVAACIAGLLRSPVVTADQFTEPPLRLGAPLLFSGLSLLLRPDVGPDQLVLLGPVAFAGWVGLFVTSFNLFPVGQLDGGHLAYALFGRGHRWVSRCFLLLLVAMGLYGVWSVFLRLPAGWPEGWPGWLVLVGVLILYGREHPAPLDDAEPLGGFRRLVGYACLLLLMVCFSPVPFGAVAL